MSTMTGTTAGGGKKLKLKLGGAAAAAAAAVANSNATATAAPAAAAAPTVSTGTVGGSSAGGTRKLKFKLGSVGSGQPAAAAAAAGSNAQSPAVASQQQALSGSQQDPQQQQQQWDTSQFQQQQQQHWDASQQQDAAMQQQQYYQQYDPSWQQQQYAQQYDPSAQQQYDPAFQQQYAQQYAQQGDASYVQQYEQYQQHEQYQQRQNRLRLQTASRLGFGDVVDEGPRYTATGRVQRKASKGIARLIAEEGGVPQDHSLAAPPPNARYVESDWEMPALERRSTRATRSRPVDDTYVDPTSLDFEGQDFVLPDEPQPKPERPKREPRPKKPRVERPASEVVYLDDDDDDPLAFEDDAADEDFDFAMEAEEATEVKVGRSGSRAAAAAAAATQRPRQSRRAAAMGVDMAVRAAAAAAGDDEAYAAPTAQGTKRPSQSPTPPLQQQPAKAAGGSRAGGRGRKRGSSKASAEFEEEEDAWELSDAESDDDLTAWEAAAAAEDDEGDAQFGTTVLGGGYTQNNYSSLALKPDHYNRPLWVCSDGRIFLEVYSPIYKQAYDFLIAIAEPVCRPESIHEYVLTPQSLYAAVSVGLDQQTILGVLDKLSKVKLSASLRNFIAGCTRSYGKVKLVLKHNRFWVETADLQVLNKLLKNSVIKAARAWDTPGADSRGLVRRAAIKEHAAARLAKLTLAAADEGVAAGAAEQLTPPLDAAAAAAAGAQPQAPAPAGAAAGPTASSAAAAAAAAAGGGGRFNDPFGGSESESDPEDFSGVPRRQPAAAAAAGAAGGAQPAAQPASQAAAAQAAAAAAESSDDEEDLTHVARPARRSSPAAAPPGMPEAPAPAEAAPAEAATSEPAPGAAADAAAASAPNGQATAAAGAADSSDDDSEDLPVVGGSRRRRQQLAAAAADGEASEMSELEEADLAADEDVDAMQLDSEQQQQPARRGRLAAVAAEAAVDAATEQAAGGGSAQAVGQLQQGPDAAAGYEDVEEEEDPEREVVAFEIKAADVEKVKRECLPGSSGLDCPLLEEYDFAHDTANKGLDIHLKKGVELRPYQEKSLSKMFGNGRARSGIIVLPCGAGKSLVGVAAAARVKKSALVLCTSSVSVDQWAYQFTLWTNLESDDVVRFVAGGGNDAQAEVNKQRLKEPCVCVTTFNMIAHKGKRSAYGEEMMRLISSQEWGLLVLDEVHVVPARMFRQVIAIVKAHCKLGLTATLVREDQLIGDLNFLIGPKMYEANWLDLTRAGHIANVQCVEVWCPMTKEFFAEYLERENKNDSIKQLLYVMNPNKFMVCQYLIDWHERVRGDKVIVFSDNVWALEVYARALNKPFIYGKTPHVERIRWLAAFKHSKTTNTVFLSKVGDNSLDIPEANVLIQISSHAGSRRQEAQRLGRILRAKKDKAGLEQGEEFNAFFYTLVSRDTQEMYYSAKRQQFLVDQGYAFKILAELHSTLQDAHFIKYRTQAEQLQLLNQVINSKEVVESLERECGKEEAGDRNDLVAKQGTWGRGKGRKVGSRSMAHATGGAGFVYNEWQQGGGKPMLSGPKGAVARQEQAAKAKKIRQRLAG